MIDWFDFGVIGWLFFIDDVMILFFDWCMYVVVLFWILIILYVIFIFLNVLNSFGKLILVNCWCVCWIVDNVNVIIVFFEWFDLVKMCVLY